MPLGYHEFIHEIQKHKELKGLLTTDDDYRKRFWLPYLPVDRRAIHLKKLRQNWVVSEKEIQLKIDPFRMGKLEKPTRIVDKGFIVGVGNPVPRFINRDSSVAKEFQGARLGLHFKKTPFYPTHLANNTVNYLSRRNNLRHRECLPVGKDSATLWRDFINATLENEIISGIPQWYHPLIATAKERLDQRWPVEKRQTYPNLYFIEFCKLFHTPSQIFVLSWIDEQLAFPDKHHFKTDSASKFPQRYHLD